MIFLIMAMVLLLLVIAFGIGWYYSPGTPIPSTKLDSWCVGYSTGYQCGWRDRNKYEKEEIEWSNAQNAAIRDAFSPTKESTE